MWVEEHITDKAKAGWLGIQEILGALEGEPDRRWKDNMKNWQKLAQ